MRPGTWLRTSSAEGDGLSCALPTRPLLQQNKDTPNSKRPPRSVRLATSRRTQTNLSILTMADLQTTLSEENIQDVLFGNRGMAVLMESVLNQVLQSEMSAHLGAEPGRLRQRRNFVRR